MLYNQSPLLAQLSAQHDLTLEPVPEPFALRPGLVKIVVSHTDSQGQTTRFALPVQWEPTEAAELLHEIRGLVWQLSDEDGLPGDYEGIRDLCHEYLYRKVGYVEPITVQWKPKVAG
jgi:hypothetical protein